MQVVTVPPEFCSDARPISIPIHRAFRRKGGWRRVEIPVRTRLRPPRTSEGESRRGGLAGGEERIRTVGVAGNFQKRPVNRGAPRKARKSARVRALRAGNVHQRLAVTVIKSKVRGCDRRCYSRSGLSKLRGTNHAFKTSDRSAYRSAD